MCVFFFFCLIICRPGTGQNQDCSSEVGAESVEAAMALDFASCSTLPVASSSPRLSLGDTPDVSNVDER